MFQEEASKTFQQMTKLDDKCLTILQGILEALNYRISQGIQPERGFYVAFGHDEEVGPALLTHPANNFN